jgi:hypothetical protein
MDKVIHPADLHSAVPEAHRHTASDHRSDDRSICACIDKSRFQMIRYRFVHGFLQVISCCQFTEPTATGRKVRVGAVPVAVTVPPSKSVDTQLAVFLQIHVSVS